MTEDLKISQQKRTGLFADCTLEEFERRMGRMREEMERTGVDGLLLTQESNVRYATAFYEVIWIAASPPNSALIFAWACRSRVSMRFGRPCRKSSPDCVWV